MESDELRRTLQGRAAFLVFGREQHCRQRYNQPKAQPSLSKDLETLELVEIIHVQGNRFVPEMLGHSPDEMQNRLRRPSPEKFRYPRKNWLAVSNS